MLCVAGAAGVDLAQLQLSDATAASAAEVAADQALDVVINVYQCQS
jgi:hypothetical protein